ncbi:hypothetical protein [Marinobacter halodurans]|nr:hypothetical protein [Marinobacter halodurans]
MNDDFGFQHMNGYFGFGHGIGMLVFAALLVFPVWRICQRAGFSGWLSLLVLVPLLNIGLLYFLAFARWPSQPDNGPKE